MERAQTAGGVLLGGEDARGGAALGAVQVAAQLGGLARPHRVDGPALAGPVAEVLRVELEARVQVVEVVEGFGWGAETGVSWGV